MFQRSPILPTILCVLLAVGAGSARAAGPVYWDWPADRPFDELDLAGTALDQDGHLVAGLTARQLGPDGPEVCWTAVPDGNGGYFTGTGHGGEIHHVRTDGENEVVAKLDGTEIFALLRLPGGDLLAGCGPEGHLFRVTPAGETRTVGTVAGGYVWALSRDAESGAVWIAAGSPAAVYRYDPAGGDFTPVVELEAQNALDVTVRSGGEVLVATQGPGLVFRLDGSGRAVLMYETAQDEARQFIVGPEGEIFLLALRNADEASEKQSRVAGITSAPPPALLALLGGDEGSETPAAALYRIGADGRVATEWSGTDELLTAAWSPRWGWLAGGPLGEDESHSSLQRLTPPHGAHVVARWAGGDVLQILVGGEEKKSLAVCQAHQGAVIELRENGRTPRAAFSPPLDGGGTVRWGRLAWQGEAPRGRLHWSVRGGNRSQPDATWTDWSDAWTEADHPVELPPCRFLQWRVVFPSDAEGMGARVTAVTVSAWQDNLAPVIAEFQLEHLKDVQLGGMLNGGENVTQRFRSGLQVEFSRGLTKDPWAGPVRGALGRTVRIFTWQGSDENGDRIAYRLAYRRQGTEVWRPISTSRPGVFETGETLLSWDTAELPDGLYDVRLTASDHPDNPTELAYAVHRITGPVLVDNSGPEIEDFSLQATADGFRVRCRVTDATSTLAGARIFLPDGSVERLDPRDRICDSRREEFAAEVAWPREDAEPGVLPWRVRLEVRDLSGNLNAVEGEVR